MKTLAEAESQDLVDCVRANKQASSHATKEFAGCSCLRRRTMMAATNNALLSRTIENNSKFIGGTLLQKELQGFAGFIAYQECFRQGNSMLTELAVICDVR
jgi:hypothetical protein